MTTFYWIRHGLTDWVGKGIAGDLPNVPINREGQQQAEALVTRLAAFPLQAIYSSPLQRTRETAGPLARQLGLEVQPRPRLIEVGSGDWTGRQLDELSTDPGWNRYNSFRSSTRAPGGELMTDIASRVVDEMEELRHRHPNQSVALFSHGDVIKVAVAQYAGIAFDLMHRLEISPASISIIQLADWGCRILAVNMTSQP